MSLLPHHVRWYSDGEGAFEWSFLTDARTLLPLAAILVAVALFAAIARKARRPLLVIPPLAAVTPWVPRIISAHLGVSLLGLAVTNSLLSPAIQLEGTTATVLSLLQGTLGVWLITGIAARVPSAAVALLGVPALFVAGPIAVLESLPVLGLAGFVLLAPPSAERYGAVDFTAERLRAPMTFLRICVGGSLVVLAFSEKLLVPGLARALLAERPELDLFTQLGLADSPDAFIRFAALTEAGLGLLIILGYVPQLIVIAAAIPFNLTLVLFDRYELLGHLPVYGTLAALVIYGSHPRLAFCLPGRGKVPSNK